MPKAKKVSKFNQLRGLGNPLSRRQKLINRVNRTEPELKLSDNNSNNDNNKNIENVNLTNLINNLDSNEDDLENKLNSLDKILSIISNQTIRETLLKQKLIQIVLNKIIKNNSKLLVTKGFKLLSELSVITGDDSICIFLYRQGFLDDIKTNLHNISNILDNVVNDNNINESKLIDRKTIFNLLESLFTLITALSMSGNEIFENSTNKLQNLPLFILDLLTNYSVLPIQLQFSAAECLYYTSIENSQYIILITSWYKNNPTKIFDKNQELLPIIKVFLIGVNYHIFYEKLDNPTIELPENISIESITESLNNLLDFFDINKLSLQENSQNEEQKSNDETNLNFYTIFSLNVAFELFTAIAEDLNFLVEDSSNSSNSNNKIEEIQMNDIPIDKNNENDDQDQMMKDNSDDDDDDDDNDNENINRTTQEYKLENTSIRLFIENIIPFSLKSLKVKSLTSHVFAMLNNISVTLERIEKGNEHSFWNKFLADEVFTNIYNWISHNDAAIATGVNDSDYFDSWYGAAGALWAVSEFLLNNSCEISIKSFDPSFVSKLITVYKSAQAKPDNKKSQLQKITDFHVRIIGLLTILSRILIKISTREDKNSSTFVLNVTKFYIDLLQDIPNTESEVSIEILNSIYDIFADKSYPFETSVFAQLGMNKLLGIEIRPKVRQMVRRVDKKKFPELRERASEAAINLDRFVSYKKNEKNETKNKIKPL